MKPLSDEKRAKLLSLLDNISPECVEEASASVEKPRPEQKANPVLRWVLIAAAVVMIVGVMCTASIMGSIAWKRSHPAGISTAEPGTQVSPEGTEGLAYTAVNHGTAWSVSVGEAGEESEIVIPATYEGLPVVEIGEHAFYEHMQLKKIVIPDSITKISLLAFAGATRLTTITYSGTVAQWEAISKGDAWDNDTADYTVICSDGQLKKTAGQTEPEITPCLHENTKEFVAKKATCTESGAIQQICVKCGEVLSKEETAPTGHHFEKEYERNSTCREEGCLKEKCRDCEETRYTYFDKVDHKYGADGICEWCFGTSSGFMFRKNEDGESYSFVGTGASFTDSVLEIPAEYNGKPVTGVHLLIWNGTDFERLPQENVFPTCITELRLPSTVKTFDVETFPSDYPDIDWSGVASVYLPEGLESIGEYVLVGASLTDLVIPSTVKDVGELAFAWCNQLKHLDIRCPEEAIDPTAFFAVDEYDRMVGYPVGLKWTTADAKITGGCWLAGPGTFRESTLILPNYYHGLYIRDIADGAFRDCTFLEEVYIEHVGAWPAVFSNYLSLFSGCTNLKKVTFGEDIYINGKMTGSFDGCSSLETLILPKFYLDWEDAEYDLSNIHLEEMYGKDVGDNAGIVAFYECDLSDCVSLKEITYPDAMERGKFVFFNLREGIVIHCDDGDLLTTGPGLRMVETPK